MIAKSYPVQRHVPDTFNMEVPPPPPRAKFIRLYGKCMLCKVLGCMHACPLPIHCTEIPRNFGALNGQWVPTRAFIHKRKAQNFTYHAFPIQSNQFCKFSFSILPPIYSSCTRPSETILTNKASIERQINRLSRDI